MDHTTQQIIAGVAMTVILALWSIVFLLHNIADDVRKARREQEETNEHLKNLSNMAQHEILAQHNRWVNR